MEEVVFVKKSEGYDDEQQARQGYEYGSAGTGQPEGQVGDGPGGAEEEESEDGVGAAVQEGEAETEDDDGSNGQYQGIADQTAFACDEAAQGKGGEDRNYQWRKAPHPVGVFDDTEGGVETEGQQDETEDFFRAWQLPLGVVVNLSGVTGLGMPVRGRPRAAEPSKV